MARRPAKKSKTAKRPAKKAAKKSAKKAAPARAAAPKLRRTQIAAPDIPLHPQPFPTACKVGNIVFSSAVSGDDPVTHEMPADPATQIRNAFRTVRRIMEEAGGSLDNIGSMKVYVKDREIRPLINQIWQETFTNEKSRPVRHMVPFDLPPGRVCQLEFLAVV